MSPLPEDVPLIEVALKAGQIGLHYFQNSDNEIWYKNGDSPVSKADKEIDEYLKNALLAWQPDYGWLSEETEDDAERLSCDRVFIVDPIDGTRGFINGRKEWCISIALIEGNRPIEAVLHAPAIHRTLYAARGKGVFIDGGEPISERLATREKQPLVTGSKKLIEVIKGLPGEPFSASPFIPSLAYRLGMVATGELDGAFAKPGASEWDIAAADLILEESDCKLTDKNSELIKYNAKRVTAGSLIAAANSRYQQILTLANSSGLLQ